MWRFLVLFSLSHKVFWVKCGTNCIDSWHLPSSLLFILTRVPTHKKYRLLCYPLRSNSGWLPIRCAYFILEVIVRKRLLKTASKNSCPFKKYAYLNFGLENFPQNRLEKTKNRFYTTMHHSVMSSEVWNFSMNLNICNCKEFDKLKFAFLKQRRSRIKTFLYVRFF